MFAQSQHNNISSIPPTQLASDLLEMASLDPTVTTTLHTNPSTAGGRRMGAAGSLAAALTGTTDGSRSRRVLPIAGDELLLVEDMDANAEEENFAA